MNGRRWEITIIELRNHGKKRYKVTRRNPELSVAETKVFMSKETAQRQVHEWLK